MNEAVNHLLLTIEYRLKAATIHIDESFANLSIGQGVRTPLEILNHMVDLKRYSMYIISDQKFPITRGSDWVDNLSIYFKELHQLKAMVNALALDEQKAKRLIQGPLADTLTHIGQLAMISRLYGKPVAKQNYSKVSL